MRAEGVFFLFLFLLLHLVLSVCWRLYIMMDGIGNVIKTRISWGKVAKDFTRREGTDKRAVLLAL